MSDLLVELCGLFEAASARLPGVGRQRMFGCDGFFRDGAIFGLIWKEGRIGVKLPEPASFAALAGEPGAVPWRAGDRVMSHWLLVPEAWHDETELLDAWIRTAHAQAPSGPKAKVRPRAAGKAKTVGKAKAAGNAKPAAKAKPMAKVKPHAKTKRAGKAKSVAKAKPAGKAKKPAPAKLKTKGATKSAPKVKARTGPKRKAKTAGRK